MLEENIKQKLLTAQKNEITEYAIYRRIADIIKDEHNREVLSKIAEDEKRHYETWKSYTGTEVQPHATKIWYYTLLARLLGLTFSIRLMEKGEGQARDNYRGIAEYIPEAVKIAAEEDEHEQRLIEIIREEKLDYVGSMILGLNDALVELTGALAGFTLALQSTSLVAATGLITGIAASLSMGGTAYLATKSEQSGKSPLKSAMYTFLSYIITVILLVSPYLIFDNLYLALAIMLGIVILIILGFNFYVSVARNTSFWKRFGEMAILSLGIAAISFGIGYLVRHFLGVDI